jgi:signal recognition particle GTPase
MRHHKEKKPSIRIVVGGPPNSGKSTFSECIARALQDLDIDAESIELDVFAPTLDYIKRKITREERDKRKQEPVTKEKIEKAVKRFKSASNKHDIVIGDAPGRISKESKLLCRIATHGIIICREDESSEIENWKSFFEELNIPIVVVIISKLDGEESIIPSEMIHATLVNLHREQIQITEYIRLLSVLLKERLPI